MWGYLLQGVLMGLLLAVLVGPIFISLLQAGLERGYKGGLSVGFGVWVSDLIFILVTYFSLQSMANFLSEDNQQFKFYMGLAGAIILGGIGLSTMLSKPKDVALSTDELGSSYPTYALKGFLVNTINPFTFFFWISVATGFILEKEIAGQNSLAFYFGIFFTIIFTDVLKVGLAHWIRLKLKFKYLLWLRRISGFLLLVFGVILFIRVL